MPKSMEEFWKSVREEELVLDREFELYKEVFDPNVSDLEYFLSRKKHHEENRSTEG